MLDSIEVKINYSNEKNNWRVDAEKNALPLIENIIKHIFIVQLIAGSLPKDIFEKYIIQDIIYCKDYQKSLYNLSQKLSEDKDKKFFEKAANSTKSIIDYLKKEYNVDESKEEYLPLCKEYSMFEKDSVNESIEQGLGSLLPCYYVYNEIGKYIQKQEIGKDNIYADFIKSTFEESKSLNVYFEICERYSKKSEDSYKRMMESFLKGVEYEYYFFDSCYNYKNNIN